MGTNNCYEMFILGCTELLFDYIAVLVVNTYQWRVCSTKRKSFQEKKPVSVISLHCMPRSEETIIVNCLPCMRLKHHFYSTIIQQPKCTYLQSKRQPLAEFSIDIQLNWLV